MAEEQDFRRFYQAEFAKVFRAALVMSGDRAAAEDATQEAFVRALERWSRLSREDWASGWVVTTAMNHARKARRRPLALQRANVVGAVDEDQRLDLWNAVRALPPKQQAAVLLHYAADIAVAHIAVLMGCAEGTVKAHLAKARGNLRSRLELQDG